MKNSVKIKSLAVALASLPGVVATGSSAAVNTGSDVAVSVADQSEASSGPVNLTYQIGNDLFGITVKHAADGTLIAQHSSHSSHSSHRSHSSHSSSRY